MPNKNGGHACCSFYNKTEDRVRKLLSGLNGVHVCDEYAALCNETLQGEFPEDDAAVSNLKGINLPRPKEIKAFLDEYVVGQEAAKRVLSVAIYSHYKRIISNTGSDAKIQESNISILDPTGSGKIYFAQMLAEILNVLFMVADVATLTEADYIGKDIRNILLRLIQATGDDVKRTEYGVVCIDEIGKIAKKSEGVSTTRNVSGENVQRALLKILEGTIASVPPQGGWKHPHQGLTQIDTTNILPTCGGAFDGLEKIVDSRFGSGGLGFNSQVVAKDTRGADEFFHQIMPQDLVKYGLIPEFIGRVPITVALDLLDENALMQILTAPGNALIKQYRKFFELDNVKLEFTEEAVRETAHLALGRKTGVRGPRAIAGDMMMDLTYEVPSDEPVGVCTVAEETVRHEAGPQIVYRESGIRQDREKPSRPGEIA